MFTAAIEKEDYEEPCCPLAFPSNIQPIPTGRVIEKLDEYLTENDYDAAERHLRYWYNEAQNGNDDRGKLTVVNEQIGLYRKVGNKEAGLSAVDEALRLCDTVCGKDSITAATTYINAATAYKAFDRPDAALPLYKAAQKIYEADLQPDDARLGGLYNNMALTVMATGDYAKAGRLFKQALAVMSQLPNGQAEMAITYCNLADLTVAQYGLVDGEKTVAELLTKAELLLNTPTLPQDGNYAFICEKCAPTFGYYGFFAVEAELSRRARKIYEGT